MTNEQLVIQLKAGIHTAEYMKQLWEQNRGMIGKIACKYKGYEDLEDLKQQGFLGLYDAVEEGYNPDQGTSFITYATFWIQQSIQRYIDDCCGVVRIPVHAKEKISQYKKVANQFQKWYGREATDKEMSLLLQISLKQLEQLKKDIQMGQIQSLDSFVLQEDDGITIADLVSAADDVEETVLDRIQKEELKEVLWEIVDDLGEDQASVIRARYQEKRTLKGIAEKNKCAIEWVRQIEKKAMKRLRIPSRANKLKPFYDGVIFDQALKGNGVARFNTTWTSSTERVALEML